MQNALPIMIVALALAACDNVAVNVETSEPEAVAAPAPFVPPEGDVTTDTHRFTLVAPGVYFVQTVAPIFNSNSMVVVNDEDVMVVDTHITPAMARDLIDSIAQVTDKPVTTVINTHFHYDHAHGNQAFDDATIIGHEFTRMKMATDPFNEPTFSGELARQPGTLEAMRQRVADAGDDEARAQAETVLAAYEAHVEASKEIDPVPPDVTISDRLTLHRGSREIQLMFLGRAHTGGDIVVHLPAQRLVYTGDMMLGGISWLGDGYVDDWPDTLERFKQLDVDLVVPGHGPTFTGEHGREVATHVQAYYRDLWAAVVELRGQGKSADEAAAEADLTAHADTLGVSQPGANLQAVQRIYQLLDERGE